ncbi:quinone-dependent dihydroorotate dehydrogenase [Actinomadura spongiicola]|nr:quinone-dependent dihydroorotate dehydrogenase [Actinomadura spongiicola]
MYESVVKPLLFRLDAERAHELTLRAAALAGRSKTVRGVTRRAFSVEHERLRTNVAGMSLANPLGLAAGFDKNARAIQIMGSMGFGHIEVGSISAFPSTGNPRPRLFRLPKDHAVAVAYGVPNEGAEAIAPRVHRPEHARLGVNLVKTNDVRRPAVEPDVYEDYARSFELLQPRADYVTLNMSCPNSAGDRDFFDELPRVAALLDELSAVAPCVPVFLKLKPIGDAGVLREIVRIADDFPFVAGFAINLPAGKPSELRLSTPPGELAAKPGAVGGPPVETLVNHVLKTLRRTIGPTSRYALTAAGGVTSADAAYRKISLGADLVQLYTGLIYRGPRLVPTILDGLLRRLDAEGHDTVSAAIGTHVDS